MIVVRVELHSAIVGTVTELARMEICNEGSGTIARGNYIGRVLRVQGETLPSTRAVLKTGHVSAHPRISQHVWNLVAKMLNQIGYGK